MITTSELYFSQRIPYILYEKSGFGQYMVKLIARMLKLFATLSSTLSVVLYNCFDLTKIIF